MDKIKNICEIIIKFNNEICKNCKSYFVCGGDSVLVCKDFEKYIKEIKK